MTDDISDDTLAQVACRIITPSGSWSSTCEAFWRVFDMLVSERRSRLMRRQEEQMRRASHGSL